MKARAGLSAAALAMIAGCAGAPTGVACEDVWDRLDRAGQAQFESRAAFLEACRKASYVSVCRSGRVAVGDDAGMCVDDGGVDRDVRFPDG